MNVGVHLDNWISFLHCLGGSRVTEQTQQVSIPRIGSGQFNILVYLWRWHCLHVNQRLFFDVFLYAIVISNRPFVCWLQSVEVTQSTSLRPNFSSAPTRDDKVGASS